MAWRIEFDRAAEKELGKLGHEPAKRVVQFILERLANRENPRTLTGSKLGNFWKYRVGDYRVIANIQDDVMCILVVRIGNRRDVYR